MSTPSEEDMGLAHVGEKIIYTGNTGSANVNTTDQKLRIYFHVDSLSISQVCNKIMAEKSIVTVGLDTEGNPVRIVQVFYPGASVISLTPKITIDVPDTGTGGTAHIFYLPHVWDPENPRVQNVALSSLLASKTKIKVGVGISGDADNLMKDKGMKLNGFIDVQDIARTLDINTNSMLHLAQMYLDDTKGKCPFIFKVPTASMSTKDLIYCAHDARLSYDLYRRITKQE